MAALSFILSFGETLSNSVDMGFHLQTVEILRDHLIFPKSAESFQREMFAYPRWSYRLAAPATWAGLSSPNALGLAATGAIAVVWLILLAAARRVSREFFLVAFLCAAATVLFLGTAFGAEVIVNYFYPQMIGEPFAVAAVLGGAYAIRRSKAAFVLLTIIAVWVCGQFHLIAALRAAGGLAVVLVFEVGRDLVGRRWRAAGWLLALPAMAAGLLLNPAFAAMRKLSVVNGGIGFARPIEMWQVMVAAIALLTLSGAILLSELRRSGREEDPRRPVLVFFAALGAAAAAAALAQGAAFVWFGESSPYAVKKHAFGVFTALAFVAPLSVWLVWSRWSGVANARLRWLIATLVAVGTLAIAGALARRMIGLGVPLTLPLDLLRYLIAAVAVIGLVGVCVHTLRLAANPRRETFVTMAAVVLATHLAILELLLFRTGQIDAPRLSSLVEDTAAVKAAAPPGADGFLFASSQSSLVVGFLVNMAALQLDRGSDQNFAAMLLATDVLKPELAPRMITELGDPTYDVPACRLGKPVGSVVPVDGACVAEAIYEFGAGEAGVPLLGAGWSVTEQDWTWSDGRRAEINLPLPPSMRYAQSPRVIIHTTGYITPESPRRTVHAVVEGGRPQTYTFQSGVSGEFTFRLDIPPDAARRGSAKIVFTIDNPEVPDPAAPRALGVAVWRMVLYPKASLAVQRGLGPANASR